MATSLKALHDRLLAEKPEGAEHDEEACPLCAEDDGGHQPDDERGGEVSKTYTEDELSAAVEKATSELAARIKELESAAKTTETEATVAAAVAEKEAELDEVRKELDAKVIEAQGEKERADLIVAWLDGEQKAAEEAAEIAARKDERLAKVKEVASFPEEYLAKNADRFAAMSDEDFETALEGWREIASRNGGSGSGSNGKIPDKTALHASRESDDSRNGASTAIRDIVGLRRNGRIDLASL